MEQNDYIQALEARIQSLEATVTQLQEQVAQLTGLPNKVESLEKLEAKVNRYQAYFSMIADIDTFKPLQELLEQGDFKAADTETAKILYGFINKDANSITPTDIEEFPAAPLRIVDRLWQQYSQGRFGLSTQLSSYREIGGDINTLIAQDEALMIAFCDRVGWRKNDVYVIRQDWTITPETPTGFLPVRLWVTPYGLKLASFILARLIKVGF